MRFPDLKENQVTIPKTTKLTFNIVLAGTDVNRTLVKNLGRNIIRKLVVKLDGNEIISIDDYDVLFSYIDSWKTATERRNAIFQGIVEADACIIPINKSDTSFSVDINSPSKSLKGVLLIFTQERSATKFARDTEEFYNPKITKVEVTVEGVPNELYAQNMEYRHQYDEILKHFAEGRLKEAGAIQKDLQLHNVNISSYYSNKYALWLDFRTIDNNSLHGSGRRLENTSEGIRLQITKKAEPAGKLSCYLYIIQDAQINISDAQFLNVVY